MTDLSEISINFLYRGRHKDATMWSRIGGMWWYNTMEEGRERVSNTRRAQPNFTNHDWDPVWSNSIITS